jgi:hypothetical protein
MKLRCVRGFRRNGEGVDVGQVLDVDPRDAHVLVHGYGYCVFVDDGEAPESPVAMTTSDPVVQHNDPKPRRRR